MFVLQKEQDDEFLNLSHQTLAFFILELEILTAPTTVVYFANEQILGKTKQHWVICTININNSISHSLKHFEIKPQYIGLKLVPKLPLNLVKVDDINKFKQKLKNYLVNEYFYEIPYYLTG